jgi:hypothetical protein
MTIEVPTHSAMQRELIVYTARFRRSSFRLVPAILTSDAHPRNVRRGLNQVS